ncbi:MAG: hypothetical protein ACYDEN_04825 [Acidimicrobiales bacterium]
MTRTARLRARPSVAFRGTLRKVVVVSLVAAGAVVAPATGALGANRTPVTATSGTATFHYGYDLTTQAPLNSTAGAVSARAVMSSFPGTYDDVAIMGWGPGNPEPSPGVYDFSGIAQRVAMIEAAGGVPVITFSGAPDWMHGGVPGQTNWATLGTPPLPAHYADFAALAAKIAAAFPTVKYFVVWKEMHGFWNQSAHAWNMAAYTQMYNDVYTAVKAVRPDALVGGPYMALPTLAGAPNKQQPTVAGPWGRLAPAALQGIDYWLANKVGADFLAVDGNNVTSTGLVGGPLVSTEKYAAADAWLASQTSLPIWWMESHLEPTNAGWPDSEAAAVRVAALIEMAGSGASVGMQWQPQDQTGWDLGLWTSPSLPGGGQPTTLAGDLATVLPMLQAGLTTVSSSPSVIVGSGPGGTVTVTGSSGPAGFTVSSSPVG